MTLGEGDIVIVIGETIITNNTISTTLVIKQEKGTIVQLSEKEC